MLTLKNYVGWKIYVQIMLSGRYISYILTRLSFIPLFFSFLRDFHVEPCQVPLENLGKYHKLLMKD